MTNFLPCCQSCQSLFPCWKSFFNFIIEKHIFLLTELYFVSFDKIITLFLFPCRKSCALIFQLTNLFPCWQSCAFFLIPLVHSWNTKRLHDWPVCLADESSTKKGEIVFLSVDLIIFTFLHGNVYSTSHPISSQIWVLIVWYSTKPTQPS